MPILVILDLNIKYSFVSKLKAAIIAYLIYLVFKAYLYKNWELDILSQRVILSPSISLVTLRGYL